MSIFSKLFPGNAKEDDASQAPAGARKKPDADAKPAKPSSAGEEGPPMQRPPNDGRGPGAPATGEGHKPKTALPTSSAKQSAPRIPVAAPHPPARPSPHASPAAKPAAGGSAAAARPPHGVPPPPTRSRPAMPAVMIGPEPTASAAAPAATAKAAAPAEARAPARTPARVEAERPPSVRPTAPEMSTPNGGPASIADTFERLLSSEDLDEGFASLEKETTPGFAHGVAPTDLEEVRSLFAQLAANHVRQVRDFMIDLRWGDTTVEWLPICEPAMRSLRRAADKLELVDLCAALDLFSEALAAIHASGERSIKGERRDALIAGYEELDRLMPQAFALDMDRSQREAVILQSLLLQVPDVKKVTIDKMYAAGLTTLEAMFLATPGDVAATTGISEALAARIVERFRAYREQMKTTVPDATRAFERQRIAELTLRLRREHDDFSRAAEAWSAEAAEKKKELRKARAQTLLDIQVELARLGEVERLDRLERLPFEQKLAHLESFLEEARDKYVAQP